MNTAPSHIVQQLLVGSSLVEAPGGVKWPAFAGRLRDSIDQGVEINDSAPNDDKGFDMRSKELILKFGVQIIVRVGEQGYGKGLVKATKIHRRLEQTGRETVSIADYDDSATIRNYEVAHVRCPNGVLYIGAGEDDERHHFSINAFLTAKEV